MLPSLVGVFVFVLYPFADVVRRSFTTVMTGEFVALDNYKKVIHNQAFMLAFKNTLHFSLVAIPFAIYANMYLIFLQPYKCKINIILHNI
jgi:multiple sugar transport system permease protein